MQETFKGKEPLLWTLVGMKILLAHFAADKAKWKLVVTKSKKFLVKELGLEETK